MMAHRKDSIFLQWDLKVIKEMEGKLTGIYIRLSLWYMKGCGGGGMCAKNLEVGINSAQPQNQEGSQYLS